MTIAPDGDRGPQPASAQTIQPGASIEADGSYCTLAWIFDGPGGTYGSTAAHCVFGVGQMVNLATGALGSVIERFGTVEFVGNADEPGRGTRSSRSVPTISAR